MRLKTEKELAENSAALLAENAFLRKRLALFEPKAVEKAARRERFVLAALTGLASYCGMLTGERAIKLADETIAALENTNE